MAAPSQLALDEHYMRQALRLAEQGLGLTSPNPPVGCVIVRDGAVIGQGYHRRLGDLHAEAAALAAAPDARGATSYITLEPCSHVGRRPACAPALVEAGIARVVYGCEDTDSRTAGLAAELFAKHDIEVTSGVLQQECERFLDGYLYAKASERSFLHLKLAVSLDGKLATAGRHSRWLSSSESLGLAHYLRQKHDAIMVGKGTVFADDPRLSTRIDQLVSYRPDLSDIEPRSPVRVILDPQLEISGQLDKLQLSDFSGMRTDLPKLIVIGLRGLASPDATKDIESHSGCSVLLLPAEFERDGARPGISFARIAEELYVLGIQSTLVEGGASVAASLLQQQAVNRLTCVVTPSILGSDALEFSPALGLVRVEQAMHLESVSVVTLGPDCAISGEPRWPAS